jgi:signal peptidase I
MRALIAVIAACAQPAPQRGPVVTPAPPPSRMRRMPTASMVPTIPVGTETAIVPGDVTRGEIVAFWFPCDDAVRIEHVKRVIALAGDTVEIRCDIVFVNGHAVPSSLVDGDHCTYDDVDELTGKRSMRDCTRYREKLGGKTYEVLGNPDPSQPTGTHDFPPLDGSIPSCRGAPVGKVVASHGTGGCEQQLHYVVPPGYLFVLGDNRYDSVDSRMWGPITASSVTGVIKR